MMPACDEGAEMLKTLNRLGSTHSGAVQQHCCAGVFFEQ